MSELKLLIGMPDPATRSGPNACEPPFVAALRVLGVEAVETTYVYGDNLEQTGIAARVRRVVSTARRVRSVSRSERFDVLHLNTSFDAKTVLRDTFTLATLGRRDLPVFLKLHGSDHTLLTTGPLPLRVLARSVVDRATAIGVLSSTERENFQAAGVQPNKLHLVRNALPNPPAELPSREQFLDSYGLPKGPPLLLFISRLIPTKGLLDTVRASALLRDRDVSHVLCCVGEGPARADAEAEAARLGLGAGARFLGYLPESRTAPFYRYCDALILPTYHDEGLPVVLLNALRAGLAIITTRTRGAIDYLSDPETCLWVEPHRPEQIADRLERLLRDGDLRNGMAERSRKLAREFEPLAVAREYVRLYEELAAAGRPAASRATTGAIHAADTDSQWSP